MKKLIFLMLLLTTGLVNAEQLISKEETDHIFSMNREAWEVYVRKIEAPEGWKQIFKPMASGTAIMSFNSDIGHGRSIKPFFNVLTQTPDILIIGIYFSPDSLPDDIEKLMNEVSRQAIIELGKYYSTDVVISNTPPLLGIELHITRKGIII